MAGTRFSNFDFGGWGMSDIQSITRLEPAQSQFPVSWYFDQPLFELEKRVLFDNGPGYVGHELMVPNVGDYQTLGWADDALMLVRNEAGIELLSNVCRHRQALMMKGRGNTPNIVCPVHRWTYDTRGELLGAPHFPNTPCLNLKRQQLQNWKGLLFSGTRDITADLAGMQVAPDLDFSGYMLDHVEMHQCNYNWKTFIEV
jgi:choline monooxygenase